MLIPTRGNIRQGQAVSFTETCFFLGVRQGLYRSGLGKTIRVAGKRDDHKNGLDNAVEDIRVVVRQLRDQLAARPPLESRPAVAVDNFQAREQRLIEWQEQLYRREIQSWDRERAAWKEREASLLEEISQLREELREAHQELRQQWSLTATAGFTGPAISKGQVSIPPVLSGPQPCIVAPAVKEESDSHQANPLTSVVGTGTVAPAPSPQPAPMMSGADQIAELLQRRRDDARSGAQEQSGVQQPAGTNMVDAALPSSSKEVTLADLFVDAIVSSTSSQEGIPSFATSLAAAIKAVDKIDVLEEEEYYRAIARGTGTNENQERQPVPAADNTAGRTDPSLLIASGSETGRGADPHHGPAAKDLPASSPAVPLEVSRGDPNGPPPVLAKGDDDIFWMSKLHQLLSSRGYHAGDVDEEDFYFGDGTENAVLVFQACEGLPETGVVDETTWSVLLALDGDKDATRQTQTLGAFDAANTGKDGHGSTGQEQGALSTSGVADCARPQPVSPFSTAASHSSSSLANLSEWPVLVQSDGGPEVHALQVALGREGYHCGDEEMQWWMFEDNTALALRMFQAAQGLPETGVADERVWQALLGEGSKPSDLAELQDDENDKDLAAPPDGAVWLLGEQRWEVPKRPALS